MMKLLKTLFICISILWSTVQANTFDYQCMDAYKDKIESLYPKDQSANEDKNDWVYKLKGYYWLAKVVSHPVAVFIVAFVPFSIPVVLGITAVASFFDILKNEKGIIGTYIILKMSELSEEEIANQDVDSKIEEEVLELQENKYSRENNLFFTFVNRVNRKYKNTNYSYEDVRKAVIEIATQDDGLCKRKGKEKFISLNRLIRLTKKKLNSNKGLIENAL
ncbi:hypothetical protein ABMA77_03755 [Halobacteriovorax sp. RZ-1]|uniref:hypothetical protein n=1 Tax=unclassified Halobacteriovorax TaxID=2639665 RepID=UPI00371138B0